MAKQHASGQLKIASIYAVIGCLWILFSDKAISRFATDPATITRISMVKGWVYVLLTAMLLYWLIRRHVDEVRLAEGKLRLSDEKFSVAFKHSPVLMSISSIETGMYLDVNEKFCQVSGFSRGEVLGRRSVELGWISAAARERLLAGLRQDGRVSELELEMTAKDGRTRYCLYSGEIVSIAGEEQLLSIALDITERKEISARLHDSEAKFRSLFEATTDAIFILDMDGNFIDVNRAAFSRLGYTREELLAMPISQLNPPEIVDRVRELLRRVREVGALMFESAHRRKDGSLMPVEVNCRLHEYEGRSVYFSIIRDITERKKAEMLLRESEERYRRFSNLTTDYVYSCSRSGEKPFRVQWIAGAVEEITGYSPAEIMALGCWVECVHPDDQPRFRSSMLSLVPGDRQSAEFRVIRKDGAIRWVRESCSCEQGASPGEMLLFGTSADITERKTAEAETAALNQHLERLVAERTASLERNNEELAAFSYAVSHELRAPIVRIQGFSAILGELCRESEETAFMASRIENASRELQSVVDSILMLSRLSLVELSLQPVDLSRMAEQKLKMLQGENPERTVEWVVMPGVEAVADPGLISICLGNLLHNAFKYTGQAPVARIEFGLRDTGGEKVYFVRDNGAGFDMGYAEKLYAPFQRLHQHQEFPGSGIGLTTVKRIINRHGGEVWAESSVGHGATFYFTLGGNS